MKIQLISDTHFEHHIDGGVGFLNSLDPSGVDVLVAAGDIGNLDGHRRNNLMHALHWMCQNYPHVVYVPGNHEFWGVHRDPLMRAFRDFMNDGHPNFVLLDNSSAVIEGRRFIGATMWFRPNPRTISLQWNWSEFQDIPQLSKWWQREATKTQKFLNREVRQGDVVVTHYCPSWQSQDPRYLGDPYSEFFIVDSAPLIMRAKPALWLHGHTHCSFDYEIEDTRVVCNPRGYLHFPNRNFDPKKVTEL